MLRKAAPASIGFAWNKARIAYRRQLPHVVQNNTIYFVTFRLADSIPRVKLEQWKHELTQWTRENPPPHTTVQKEQFADLGYRQMERWLDMGAGACILNQTDVRGAIEECLRFGDGKSYWLGDFVIMPNHVHVLVQPDERMSLRQIIAPWRTISTQKINKLLGIRGKLWQRDWFDHIVRNQGSLGRIRRYIRENGRYLSPSTYTSGEGLLFK